MRTALVTGASGMLGSHLAARLAADGWSVRTLVRAGSAAWPDRPGMQICRGDLNDPASLLRAARGCDTVFHAGAAVGSKGTWEMFQALNVAGTTHVVDAAAACGARLVHVSSTAVYGQHRYRPQPTDEDSALPDLPVRDVYGRSKQDAERVVLDACRSGKLWATVVRPAVMYGEGDRQFVPRLGPVFLRGVFPLIAGGTARLPLVHAAAVADAAVRAAAFEGAAGRVYLLANDTPVTVADLARFAAAGLGRTIRTPPISLAAGRVTFHALRAALVLAGRRDLAAHTDGTFRMLTRDNPFTSRRAHEELGWAPHTDTSSTLPAAFRSWMASRSTAGRR